MFGSKNVIALLYGFVFCFLVGCSHVGAESTPALWEVEKGKAYVGAESTPAFWKVDKGEASVYLLGSMHFGREDFYPLPQAVEQAYLASDRLTVELDISKIQPAAAMQAVYKYGGMPIGQTLKTSLSSSVYQSLAERCEINNLPVSAFDSFQPWFVSMQLVEAEIKKTNLRPNLGIDAYFLARGGKPVDELETIESQMGLFSQFSIKEQSLFLEQTLKDLEDSQTYLNTMAEGWRSGNLDELEEQLLAPFRENASTERLYGSLFTLRNIQMTNAVEAYLKGSEKIFFIVGAGHMIGSDGIVASLKGKGYKVERIQFSDK